MTQRTINIGPDGVLYSEGGGEVLTSATPLPESVKLAFDRKNEIKILLKRTFSANWSLIKDAIDLMPANCLVSLLESLEPVVRLIKDDDHSEKELFRYAVAAQIEGDVEPYWKGIVHFLVTEFVKNYDRLEDLKRSITNHYAAAKIRLHINEKFQSALPAQNLQME